jgi:hypothetical protein
MKTAIVKGLLGEAKEEMEREFKASALLRQRLQLLLNEKITSSHKESMSKNAYEKASWPYEQADARGYERALTEIISLLES